LACKYDINERFQKVNGSVPMGEYVNGGFLFKRQNEIATWNYKLCKPSFSLDGLTGYLGRFKMVSLQTLETTNKNLSLVISTSSPVICTRGFTDDNYFNLKIGVPQDKAFQALSVRFKVLVKC
jgi:hypothetical protein